MGWDGVTTMAFGRYSWEGGRSDLGSYSRNNKKGLMPHAHQRARAWKYMCARAHIHWVLHPIFMHARKKRTNPRTRTLVCMKHNADR